MLVKALKRFTFTNDDGKSAVAHAGDKINLKDNIAEAMTKYGYCKVGADTKAIEAPKNKMINTKKQMLNKAANE